MRRGHAGDAALALLRKDATLRRAPTASSFLPSAATAATGAAASRSRRRCPAIWDGGRRGYATRASGNRSIAVLGGGLTGLTTAYYLAKSLPQTNKIILYEGADRLGGWIKTDRAKVDVGGVSGTVTFERGARSFNSLHNDVSRFDDLVLWNLISDLGIRPHFPPSGTRYIYYPDHLVPLPAKRATVTDYLSLAQERLFLDSAWEGLTTMANYYANGKQGKFPAHDVSVAHWLRHISGGDSIGNNVVSAMMHGIYGGDIDYLSAETTLSSMWMNYYASPLNDKSLAMVSTGDMNLVTKMNTDWQVVHYATAEKDSHVHFGPLGMETLVTSLRDALKSQDNVEIRLNERVTGLALDSTTGKLKVSSAKPQQRHAIYDKVISTLEKKALSEVLSPKIPAISSLASVSVMMVNIWYPQENLKPPGFGYLIPRSVDRETLNPERALGVMFDSDIGVRGPDEPRGTKLCVMLGGHYYKTEDVPIPSEGRAIDQAKAVLERHLGIPRDTPCYATANLNVDCIPQPMVHHSDRLREIMESLRDVFDGRLAVAGGSFHRVGALGALRSGYESAQPLIDNNWTDTGLKGLNLPGGWKEMATLRKAQVNVRNFK